MRISVRKILFIGAKETLDLFFERAQKIGWFQFTSVGKKKLHLLPKRIDDLKSSIKELRKQPVSHTPLFVGFDEAARLVDRILALKREIENLHEEIRRVTAEVAKMHPLGHFNINEIKEIENETGRKFHFYLVRHDKYPKEEIPEGLIYINREYDFDYYLTISKEPVLKPGFIEIPIQKSLNEWEKELKRLKHASHEAEAELKSLADYLECLEDFLIHEMNGIHLNFSKEDADLCLEKTLFSVDAWIPDNKIDQLDRLIEGLAVSYKEVAVEKDEIVPTYLENKGLSEVGQDLVEIYDTPSSQEKDPSTWVLWSFAIFFGMIVSDAGYGLIFLIFSLYLWSKRKKLKNSLKRMTKLMLVLSSTSIIWGILIASYFSIPLGPNSPFSRFSILHYLAVKKIDYYAKQSDPLYKEWMVAYPELKSSSLPPEKILELHRVKPDGSIVYTIMDEIYDSILMEIALVVGVVHLTLSFLRNLKNAWAGIGWIGAIWGGYLFFPHIMQATPFFNSLGLMTKATSTILGEQLLYGGLATAFLLSLIQQGWGGFAAVFKVIEVFADSLSYLRLYALGLAGVVLASTCNKMAAEAGYVGGVMILIFGHTINMGLAAAAGMIHGLRLNFLEWYHHSYEGGGKKFNPLRLIIRE